MTSITVNIPNHKVSFFKKLISEMGWTYELNDEAPKARLYDPETGKNLNKKTMKLIEDVRNGKEKMISYDSFEDFEKAMRAL